MSSNGPANGTDRANGSGAAASTGTTHTRRIGVIPVVRGGASPTSSAAGIALTQGKAPVEPTPTVRAARTGKAVRAAEARARRRGMLTRLALFAVGLVISLIAVETVSRRRS